VSPEQREIALWAGGTAVLVIIGWIWIATRGGAVADHQREVDQLHSSYRDLYLDESGERLPVAEALAELQARSDDQRREVRRIESQSVWPGQGGEGLPPEFEGVALGASSGVRIGDYASALDQVSRTTSRLRRRAESLGIDLPAALPLEASGAVSADNGPLRQLQLARVCTYAALLDLVMDADIDQIGPLQASQPAWVSADGEYAVIPVSTVLHCSYESADTVMRSLRENAFGLGLEQIALDYEDDGGFRMAITVRLVVRALDEWELGRRASPSAAGGGAPRGTPRRRGGR